MQTAIESEATTYLLPRTSGDRRPIEVQGTLIADHVKRGDHTERVRFFALSGGGARYAISVEATTVIRGAEIREAAVHLADDEKQLERLVTSGDVIAMTPALFAAWQQAARWRPIAAWFEFCAAEKRKQADDEAEARAAFEREQQRLAQENAARRRAEKVARSWPGGA